MDLRIVFASRRLCQLKEDDRTLVNHGIDDERRPDDEEHGQKRQAERTFVAADVAVAVRAKKSAARHVTHILWR